MPNGRQRPAERVARASLALHGVQFLLLALVATLLAIAGYGHVELVRAVAGVVSVRSLERMGPGPINNWVADQFDATHDRLERWGGANVDSWTYRTGTATGFVVGTIATGGTSAAVRGSAEVIEAGAVVKSASVAAETVPARLARVTEARFAGSPSLGPPGAGRVFVTAADDIEGITTSQGLAQRLTLLDDAGKLREGPFSITSFDTPSEGLGVPVFRSNPGFVQGGFTGGGAREFDLPNLPYSDLGNVDQRIVP